MNVILFLIGVYFSLLAGSEMEFSDSPDWKLALLSTIGIVLLALGNKDRRKKNE